MDRTSADILTALRRYHERGERGYGPVRWLFFEELQVHPQHCDRRLDAYALDCWGGGSTRIAYEVKVSRADFLAEIRNPQKRKWALLVSSEYYFATPKGLVKPAEIPAEAGLIEVDEEGNCRIRVVAPHLTLFPPKWSFLAGLVRRAWELRATALGKKEGE